MEPMAGLALTAPVGLVCAACGYEILVEDPSRACPLCQAVTRDSTTRAPLANVIDLAEYRLRRSQPPQAKGAR
jgi:rubrerythrin